MGVKNFTVFSAEGRGARVLVGTEDLGAVVTAGVAAVMALTDFTVKSSI
jgi:hypothetical protein